MFDPEDDPETDDMVSCDYCGGMFFRDDMDGDHCHDCAEELFDTEPREEDDR